MASVLIFSDSLTDELKARLAKRYHLLDFSSHKKPSIALGFDAALAQADAAIGARMIWDRETIGRAKRLKVLSSVSVGVDNYDLAALEERGILLGHTPGVLAETTADLAMALMLGCARRVVELDSWVRSGHWTQALTPAQFGSDVHHRKLGIVGMGRTGQALARRARLGFGMDILYHSRSTKPLIDKELNARHTDLRTLLSESDFVCAALPATPATHHMFDASAFKCMQPGAIFINVARGAVVNEAALVQALESGQLRAAGLDVFEQEPVSSKHPLLGRRDVIVMPHAGSATAATRHNMAHMAVNNLIAGLEGQAMPACYNVA